MLSMAFEKACVGLPMNIIDELLRSKIRSSPSL